MNALWASAEVSLTPFLQTKSWLFHAILETKERWSLTTDGCWEKKCSSRKLVCIKQAM